MDEKLSNVGEMIDTAIDKSKRLKEGILKSDWEKIVGRLVNESQPEYIKDGVLTIVVESPLFVHHFTGKKEHYIKEINNYFGKNIINDINIRNGKLNKDRDVYLNKVEEQPEETQEEKEELELLEATATGIAKKIGKLQKMAEEREKYLLSKGCKKCKGCGVIFEPIENEDFCMVCITAKINREKAKAKAKRGEQ